MRPLDRHTVAGIANELRRGRTWAQIARRYLLGSAEEAKSAYYRWRWASTHAAGRA